MIDDRQTRDYAGRKLAQHGGDAWFAVAQDADASLERGDLDGQRLHLRVLKCIAQIEAEPPAGAVH